MLIIALMMNPSFAQGPDRSLSPYFFVQSDSGAVDQLPLKSTSAEVRISGVCADVNVRQVYMNEGNRTIEANYVFPASTRAAVYGMTMKIGNRFIEAEIREKQKARDEYEQAKADGKSASLLEEDRPNVFSMNVANIRPGEQIEVLLKYTEILILEDGIYEFAYPAVVGPRYTGSNDLQASAETGAVPGNSSGSFAAQPYLHKGESQTVSWNLNVRLAAGMPVSDISSPSHKIGVKYSGLENAEISADPDGGGNRDFILKYRLSGGEMESGLLLYNHGDEKFFLCMIQPPKLVEPKHIPPVEYVFIVDVSGSMNGWPLDISKQLLRNLLTNLRPEDQFNVILFAGTAGSLSPVSVLATEENIETAMEVIDNQRGGGGTEVLTALRTALDLPRREEGVARSFVIITDGYVTVEREAFGLIRNRLDEANFFAFGVGSSVNRYIIEGIAKVGMTEPYVVTDEHDVATSSGKFFEAIRTPVLTRIKVEFQGFDAYDVEPGVLPDVLSNRPVLIQGKWRGEAGGKIKLSGHTGKGKFISSIEVSGEDESESNSALRTAWARKRISKLDDFGQFSLSEEEKKEVIWLGLEYNLLTAFTSFVAVDHIISTEGGEAIVVNQPLPMPQGVENSAVGFDLELMKVIRHQKEIPAVAGLPEETKNQENHSGRKGESITFIMGEDKQAGNHYYTNALEYYRYVPEVMTEYVVTTCRSLYEIREHLECHAPAKGKQWGLINIVVHSNEWTGMETSVMPGGPRANRELLDTHTGNLDFLPLNDSLVNQGTTIVIHGCALGNDRPFLELISTAFGGRDGRKPKVISSKYFVMYNDGVDGRKANRSLARYYFVHHPAFYRPDDSVLAASFTARYPGASMAWEAILKREQPRFPGDPYCHTFRVPVKWVVTYSGESELPDLEKYTAQQEWLEKQPELLHVVRELGMKKNDFMWTFTLRSLTFEDGMTEPAVQALGLCNIVCALQTITDPAHPEYALQPRYDDETYYSATGGF